MSRICMISGKRALTINSRSHSNIATKRQQKVNLQMIKIGNQRLRVSARAARALKRAAAVAHGEIPTKREKKAAKKAALLAAQK